MKIGKFNIRSPFAIVSEEIQRYLPLTTGADTTGKRGIKPGRESEDPADVAGHTGKYTPIEPDFSLEWLPILERLAVYNQDVGYAVDNIVQLANTPYQIEFRDDVNDAVKKEIIQLIDDHKDRWYNYSEGLNSFRSDMYAQAAINGAMSMEIIPNKTLDDISLVRVAPKNIRFLYDKKEGTYKPFQVVKNPIHTDVNIYGLKELNTIKYQYVAWRRIHEGPYPVPPFLTAVRTLDIQEDIIKNLAFIIEKLGMLGFLSAKVEPPVKNPGEDKTAYFKRCLTYLEKDVYPQLEKNLSKGMVVGYKGSHEFEMHPSSNNPRGAQDLIKIVEQMLFAGLKQDPNMLGRNFSTTETFGKVILAKMTNQVKEYQNMMNAILKETFRLFILLRGYDKEMIKGVTCEPAMVRDKVQDATARSTEIDNVLKLRDNKIIDQTQAAIELGYEKAADPKYEGTVQPNNDTDPKKDDEEVDEKDNEETQKEIKRIEKSLRKHSPEYLYETHDCHGLEMTFMKSSDFGDKTMNGFVKNYAGKIHEEYSKFVVKALNSAVKAIQRLNESAPIQHVQDAVYLAILNDWENGFMPKIDLVTETNVTKIYSHYRKDDSIFPKKEGFAKSTSFDFEIPEPLFNLDDFRTIEYAAQSDTMYLGKFITDENTKKKIYKYLDDVYIKGEPGIGIGKAPKAIAKFKSKFSNIFEFESYKIKRIVDTSVNNLRNDANIQYINQAELEQYEVVEIGDNRTCDYCNHMNGAVYSINNAISKINTKINSTPENIGLISPFATNLIDNDPESKNKYLNPEKFMKLSHKEIADKGITTPSYHAGCRGRIVAKQ